MIAQWCEHPIPKETFLYNESVEHMGHVSVELTPRRDLNCHEYVMDLGFGEIERCDPILFEKHQILNEQGGRFGRRADRILKAFL